MTVRINDQLLETARYIANALDGKIEPYNRDPVCIELLREGDDWVQPARTYVGSGLPGKPGYFWIFEDSLNEGYILTEDEVRGIAEGRIRAFEKGVPTTTLEFGAKEVVLYRNEHRSDN